MALDLGGILTTGLRVYGDIQTAKHAQPVAYTTPAYNAFDAVGDAFDYAFGTDEQGNAVMIPTKKKKCRRVILKPFSI